MTFLWNDTISTEMTFWDTTRGRPFLNHAGWVHTDLGEQFSLEFAFGPRHREFGQLRFDKKERLWDEYPLSQIQSSTISSYIALLWYLTTHESLLTENPGSVRAIEEDDSPASAEETIRWLDALALFPLKLPIAAQRPEIRQEPPLLTDSFHYDWHIAMAFFDKPFIFSNISQFRELPKEPYEKYEHWNESILDDFEYVRLQPLFQYTLAQLIRVIRIMPQEIRNHRAALLTCARRFFVSSMLSILLPEGSSSSSEITPVLDFMDKAEILLEAEVQERWTTATRKELLDSGYRILPNLKATRVHKRQSPKSNMEELD